MVLKFNNIFKLRRRRANRYFNWVIDMTQISQNRRTRITPPSQEVRTEFSLRNEQREALGMRCRAVFERLLPTQA